MVSIIFGILRRTWRFVEDPLPDVIQKKITAGQPVVFAHFHEDEIALLGIYSGRKMNVLVSLSKDGDLMTRFLKSLGYCVARGSSSRGGAAGLLSLIRQVQAAPLGGVGIAVDGPRGPRRRAKKGIFKLAESLEAPIVAGVAVTNKPFVFKKAWSRAFLPLPFSTIQVCYSEVISAEDVKKSVERDDFALLSHDLETRLKTAKSMAYQKLSIPQ